MYENKYSHNLFFVKPLTIQSDKSVEIRSGMDQTHSTLTVGK